MILAPVKLRCVHVRAAPEDSPLGVVSRSARRCVSCCFPRRPMCELLIAFEALRALLACLLRGLHDPPVPQRDDGVSRMFVFDF